MSRRAAVRGKEKDGLSELDPSIIYFTFSRIRPYFSCGRAVSVTLQQLASGQLTPHDLPTLTVLVDHHNSPSSSSPTSDGVCYFSLNNRRLYVYKKLHEMKLLRTIPVRLRPVPQSRRMASKYSPAKCSLTATLMSEHSPRGGHYDGTGRYDSDEDGDEEEVVVAGDDSDAEMCDKGMEGGTDVGEDKAPHAGVDASNGSCSAHDTERGASLIKRKGRRHADKGKRGQHAVHDTNDGSVSSTPTRRNNTLEEELRHLDLYVQS